jgi:hypothetical protein
VVSHQWSVRRIAIEREILHGIVGDNGNTIRLSRPSRFADEVRVDVVATRSNSAPARSLAELHGAWAEDADELDESIEWARQQRKIERRPQDE